MRSNEVVKVVTDLRRLGWRIESGRNAHYKVYPPSGPMITLPSSPGDYRGWKNVMALLRKAGYDPKAQPKKKGS